MFRFLLQITRAVSLYRPNILQNFFGFSERITRSIQNSYTCRFQNFRTFPLNLFKNSYNNNVCPNDTKFSAEKPLIFTAGKLNLKPIVRNFYNLPYSVNRTKPFSRLEVQKANVSIKNFSTSNKKSKGTVICTVKPSNKGSNVHCKIIKKKKTPGCQSTGKEDIMLCVCKKLKKPKKKKKIPSCCKVPPEKNCCPPCKPPSCKKPDKNPCGCKTSSCKIPSFKEIKEGVLAYFKARPGCPEPDEWKQKLLEEKARKAAEAAGFQLCCCKPRKPPPKKEKNKFLEHLCACIKANLKPKPKCPPRLTCKQIKQNRTKKCSNISLCKNYPVCSARNKKS